MKLWKRNLVVAAIMLFVCAAVYLNWSYNQGPENGSEAADGKLLGSAELVSGTEKDTLLNQEQDNPSVETNGEKEDGTATKTGYFSSARLNRQQARDSALSLLRDAAADESAGQEAIDAANESIQTMAALTLSEAQIENLITAKGYSDCVCFIGESSASVVVASVDGGLLEADTAKIIEIVKEQTNLKASQIKIIEAEP